MNNEDKDESTNRQTDDPNSLPSMRSNLSSLSLSFEKSNDKTTSTFQGPPYESFSMNSEGIDVKPVNKASSVENRTEDQQYTNRQENQLSEENDGELRVVIQGLKDELADMRNEHANLQEKMVELKVPLLDEMQKLKTELKNTLRNTNEDLIKRLDAQNEEIKALHVILKQNAQQMNRLLEYNHIPLAESASCQN